jgi:hypothetical protein
VLLFLLVATPQATPRRDAPAGLHLTATTDQSTGTSTVTLAWDAVASVSGYKLYAGTDTGSYSIIQDVGLQTTGAVTVPTPTTATTFYFAVTAYAGDPVQESAYSNEVTAVLPTSSSPPSSSGLALKTVTVASDPVAGTSIATLTWDPSLGVGPNAGAPNGYKIYGGSTAPGVYSFVTDVGLTTTGKTNPIATPAGPMTFYFAVTAYRIDATTIESGFSNELTALIPAESPPPPPPPPNPCLTSTGTNVLAIVLKAYQTTVKAPGPGWVVAQVLDYSGKPLTGMQAHLSDGSIVANVGPTLMANVRVWSGLWIRPPKAGKYDLFVTVTNADNCAAESAHVPLTVQ